MTDENQTGRDNARLRGVEGGMYANQNRVIVGGEEGPEDERNPEYVSSIFIRMYVCARGMRAR